MSKTKKNVAKLVKRIADSALTRDANSTTCVAVYQPKAPANLARFKKNSDQ